MPISLALVLHAHQPADNFDSVVEEAYAKAYAPFLEEAQQHPGLKFTLHFSGWLLRWLADRHPDYIASLRALRRARRVEILGGGYFEPILAALPERDRREQLRRLRDLVGELFGAPPRGAWLAERVWEPSLAATLAEGGIEYTVLDDVHFLPAGLEREQTYGYFLTEHAGRSLKLLASSYFLRLAIPFRAEGESLDFLAAAEREHPGGLLTMGDDLEKFGAWPHTHEHVIRGGWLARYFARLREASAAGWLRTERLEDYLDAHPPLGTVYPPTASYEEMMQWALPTKAAAVFARAREDEAIAPYRRFLLGAPWSNFFVKYPESNSLREFALQISRRLERAAGAGAAPEPAATHLLAAECNDVYWHGLFGGIYAPHLRNAAYTRLLRADAQLPPPPPEATPREAAREVRSARLRAVVNPEDGGVIEELDYLPAFANVINSIARRPETYHRLIRERIADNPARLPGGGAAPEADLARILQYDSYRRACGRVHLFPADHGWREFLAMALGEDPTAAAGAFAWSQKPGGGVLERAGIRKELELRDDGAGSELDLRVAVAERRAQRGIHGDPAAPARLAVEVVFNLLAPAADDRWMQAGERRMRLDWEGEIAAPAPGHLPDLVLTDGWRRFALRLTAPGATHWWARPIHTVSQSEAGYEAVYQGSSLLAVWPPGERNARMNLAFHPLA